ncbi:hypothetical protein M758_UG040000 [Ceratodon purpureus]|nr:hypothetical protein M758_UG040000 [Ceratodon purpureus]
MAAVTGGCYTSSSNAFPCLAFDPCGAISRTAPSRQSFHLLQPKVHGQRAMAVLRTSIAVSGTPVCRVPKHTQSTLVHLYHSMEMLLPRWRAQVFHGISACHRDGGSHCKARSLRLRGMRLYHTFVHG